MPTKTKQLELDEPLWLTELDYGFDRDLPDVPAMVDEQPQPAGRPGPELNPFRVSDDDMGRMRPAERLAKERMVADAEFERYERDALFQAARADGRKRKASRQREIELAEQSEGSALTQPSPTGRGEKDRGGGAPGAGPGTAADRRILSPKEFVKTFYPDLFGQKKIRKDFNDAVRDRYMAYVRTEQARDMQERQFALEVQRENRMEEDSRLDRDARGTAGRVPGTLEGALGQAIMGDAPQEKIDALREAVIAKHGTPKSNMEAQLLEAALLEQASDPNATATDLWRFVKSPGYKDPVDRPRGGLESGLDVDVKALVTKLAIDTRVPKNVKQKLQGMRDWGALRAGLSPANLTEVDRIATHSGRPTPIADITLALKKKAISREEMIELIRLENRTPEEIAEWVAAGLIGAEEVQGP